ncbi:MAG: hypothetical protein HYY95_16105 [Candidatus Rokubacteria bacterium]|nr:hypothetical protein [Candidatus Rokubacteria bacterium]
MVLTGVIPLTRLLLGATPPSSDRQRAAIDLVDVWLRDRGSEPVRWFCPRAEFGSRLKQLVLEPWRLRQGSFGWCLPAAFLNAQFRRFPETVARFGVSLYDTGAGTLGSMSIEVPAELYAFDLPTYVRGELASAPLPPGRTRPIVFTHTDWILLGAVQDESNDVIDYEGPINDTGASPNITQGSCAELFEGTGLYTEVKSIGFAASETPASALAKLGPSEKTDIVLFGRFSFFTTALESPVGGLNAHAVALVNQPVLEGGEMKLCFFSWGDEAPVVTRISPVTGGLELAAGAGAFGPAPVSNVSGAVIARVA